MSFLVNLSSKFWIIYYGRLSQLLTTSFLSILCCICVHMVKRKVFNKYQFYLIVKGVLHFGSMGYFWKTKDGSVKCEGSAQFVVRLSVTSCHLQSESNCVYQGPNLLKYLYSLTPLQTLSKYKILIAGAIGQLSYPFIAVLRQISMYLLSLVESSKD